jgi:hypothetical protein
MIRTAIIDQKHVQICADTLAQQRVDTLPDAFSFIARRNDNSNSGRHSRLWHSSDNHPAHPPEPATSDEQIHPDQ